MLLISGFVTCHYCYHCLQRYRRLLLRIVCHMLLFTLRRFTTPRLRSLFVAVMPYMPYTYRSFCYVSCRCCICGSGREFGIIIAAFCCRLLPIWLFTGAAICHHFAMPPSLTPHIHLVVVIAISPRHTLLRHHVITLCLFCFIGILLPSLFITSATCRHAFMKVVSMAYTPPCHYIAATVITTIITIIIITVCVIIITLPLRWHTYVIILLLYVFATLINNTCICYHIYHFAGFAIIRRCSACYYRHTYVGAINTHITGIVIIVIAGLPHTYTLRWLTLPPYASIRRYYGGTGTLMVCVTLPPPYLYYIAVTLATATP